MTDAELREVMIQWIANRGDSAPDERIGMLGLVFGGRHAASRNLAGVVILLAAALLIAAVIGDLNHERDLITASVSLISLALGYLFGSRSQN